MLAEFLRRTHRFEGRRRIRITLLPQPDRFAARMSLEQSSGAARMPQLSQDLQQSPLLT
jgi:hypothetical protein